MIPLSATVTKDRPLTSREKSVMVLAAFLSIGLFYAFAAVALVLLVATLGIEAVVMILGFRFGLGQLLFQFLRRHVMLAAYVWRSLWLKEGPEFHVEILPSDAPALFACIETLTRRFEIKPPEKIVLVGGVEAWVRLDKGSRGSEAPKLGLGYDLIAGLTVDELEAVLAHELAHAKLVRRTSSTVLKKGSARSARLATAFRAMRRDGRGKTDVVANSLFWPADKLARLTVRLVARYSRQDEFEADAGAASIVGPGPLSSSLVKLRRISEKTSRIALNERIAQLQQPNGLSTWLSEELSVEVTLEEALSEDFRSTYSTHPALADRLAALNSTGHEARPSPKATTLLANPDALAMRLVHEIRRLGLIAEQNDARAIRAHLRRMRTGQTFRWPQWVAFTLFVLVVFCSFSFSTRETTVFGYCTVPPLVAGFVLVLLYGRPKDKEPVPIPGFTTLVDGELTHVARAGLAEADKKVEAEVQAGEAGAGKAIRTYQGEEARKALLQGDYLRTFVVARRAFNRFKTQGFPDQALAIGAAGLGRHDVMFQSLRRVQKSLGFSTNSSLWGAGWAFYCAGDMATAEAALQELGRRKVREVTVLGLLGRTRLRRGKFQTALVATKEALAMAPGDRRLNEQVVDIHLATGALAEGRSAIDRARGLFPADRPLMLRAIRLALLEHDHARADVAIAAYSEAGLTPVETLELAVCFERARRDDAAVEHYRKALQAAFLPAAHLGLARIAFHRKDGAAALEEALASMNTELTVAPDSVPQASLFIPALQLCLSAYQPVHVAQAFNGFVPKNPLFGPSGGHTFTVVAPDLNQAKGHLERVLKARVPSKIIPLDTVAWSLAPKERQPEGTVRPGIHHVA